MVIKVMTKNVSPLFFQLDYFLLWQMRMPKKLHHGHLIMAFISFFFIWLMAPGYWYSLTPSTYIQRKWWETLFIWNTATIFYFILCLQAVKGELTGRRGSSKVTVNQMDHGSTSHRGHRGKTSKRIKQA